MKYKINDIFYSIQGEGLHSGTPTVFIRLSGCNRRCDFCDTKHEEVNFEFTKEELYDYILNFSECRRLVFTGGEPTVQDILALVKPFRRKWFWVGIETNGQDIENAGEFGRFFDWVTFSPKDSCTNLKKCSELKVVYQGQDLEQYKDIKTEYRFLQPLDKNGKTNINETLNAVQENPKWRLSLQIHKTLGIK